MKLFRVIQTAIALTVFCAPLAAAQTGDQQTPPAPKPGPEQEVLKKDVGTWDAVVEFAMAPGAPPQTSKGVEVNIMGCGGLCLISDFKGEAMGAPFQGHGVTAWDGVKKKYTGMWMDSMSAAPALTEGTFDGKKWSGSMEGPDMTGKIVKSRNSVEWKDANTRVMTAWAPGPDGKEMQVLKITFTRKM